MMTFLCSLCLLSGLSADLSVSYAPVASKLSVLDAPHEMKVVRVNNGRCEVYSATNGCYQRSFGYDIVQASISGDTVAAVNQHGRVEIYQASTGSYLRSFGYNAVSAQIQGDNVAVTCSDGRTEIYQASTGSYQRSF